jgi:hypothetical protein
MLFCRFGFDRTASVLLFVERFYEAEGESEGAGKYVHTSLEHPSESNDVILEKINREGSVACFREALDTEIPKLQNWCRSLTLASRERAKNTFLNRLDRWITSMRDFFSRDHGATKAECDSMRSLWESPHRRGDDLDPILAEWDEPLTPISQVFEEGRAEVAAVGISARLRQVKSRKSFVPNSKTCADI